MKFIKIGKVHSAQGIKGDIYVYLFAEEAYWVDRWMDLHLGDIDATKPSQSIKIKKVKIHQKQKKVGFVLTLDGFINRNLAEEIVGQGVFVPEEFFVSDEGEGLYLREILGFRVHDEQRGDVGEVVDFAGNDLQDLLVIKNDKDETFEVPFVEPLLIEVDKEHKVIRMQIPYGLVSGEEL